MRGNSSSYNASQLLKLADGPYIGLYIAYSTNIKPAL